MEVAEDLEIEAVEERGGTFAGDLAEEEAVVVDGEAVALLAVAVPEHADALAGLSLGAGVLRADVVLGGTEDDLGGEAASRPARGGPVDDDAPADGRGASHFDAQPLLGDRAQTVMKDGAMDGELDVQHGGISAAGNVYGKLPLP